MKQPVTPKVFAQERGISYNLATEIFSELERAGVSYVWREGKKTDAYPKGKLLFMDAEAYENYKSGALKLPLYSR